MSSVHAHHSPERRRQLCTRARQLRRNPTASEHILWQAIRGKRLGVEFRRQVVIGDYIADFLCHRLRLIIEVDGGYHVQRAYLDAARQRKLERAGYTVLRFTDAEVMRELGSVVERIREEN